MSVAAKVLLALFWASYALSGQDAASLLDFSSARRVGECLARGCAIYVGVVGEVGTPWFDPSVPSERAFGVIPITLSKVESVHPREVDMGDDLQLERYLAPRLTNKGIGPWSVWEGLDLRIGDRLTVVEIPHDPYVYGGRTSRRLELVTSDESVAEAVRAAAHLHERYGDKPQLLLLGESPAGFSAAFKAGFAVGWLSILSRRYPEAGLTLVRLAGDAAVPGFYDSRLSFYISGAYRSADAILRIKIIESLLQKAIAGEQRVAATSFTTIARILNSEHPTDVWGVPDALRVAAELRYRSLTSPIERNLDVGELERALGVNE